MDKILAPIKQRIIQLIELKELEKNKFYKELGVSGSNFRSQSLFSEVGGEVIAKILAKFPDINAEWLITGKGSMYNIDNNFSSLPIDNNFNEINTSYIADNIGDEVKLFDLNQEPEIFTNNHGNKFHIYPDGTIRIEVLKIPFPAYASYVESYFDEVKLKEDFSTITFKVDHIGRGYYLGFESTGDSMWNNGGYDTPSGADILGREIDRQLWIDGFRKTTYGFIIVSKQGIWHKDIKEITNDGKLVLTSRNPECKPFKYPVDDIKQIFHVIKRSF
ncbi:helix-turn-helix domain-containing protein [Empedobacter falsenii]